MHIHDILNATSGPKISFEFFPPNTSDGNERLRKAMLLLGAVGPAFVSITYGAGGSTRQTTQRLVEFLSQQTSMQAVPHLTCVRQQPEDINAILENYVRLGVSNILALRGDVPSNIGNHDHNADSFPYGKDLVRHIQKFNSLGTHPDKRGFGIGVAGFPEGHPATPNRLLEMDHLKAKIDAGADYICTQLFFDNRDFHDFRERCLLAGIRVPILAGILPVTTMAGLRRMAQLAGGARVPARLLKALLKVEQDPAAVREVGLHHATEQCAELRHQNVAGIHFYTLNQAGPALEILRRLGMSLP